jgi:hypothetical protein
MVGEHVPASRSRSRRQLSSASSRRHSNGDAFENEDAESVTIEPGAQIERLLNVGPVPVGVVRVALRTVEMRGVDRALWSRQVASQATDAQTGSMHHRD